MHPSSPPALRRTPGMEHQLLTHFAEDSSGTRFKGRGYRVEQRMLRIEFWGPLYYNYTKEPPKNSIGNY